MRKRKKPQINVRRLAAQLAEMTARVDALERELNLLTRRDRVDDALARIAQLEQAA